MAHLTKKRILEVAYRRASSTYRNAEDREANAKQALALVAIAEAMDGSVEYLDA